MIEAISSSKLSLLLWINVFSITVCIYLLNHIISNQKLQNQSRFILLILLPLGMFIFSLNSITLAISTPDFANVSTIKNESVNATVNYTLGWYDVHIRQFLYIVTLIAIPFIITLVTISRFYSVEPKRRINFLFFFSAIIIIDAILGYIIYLYFDKIPLLESLIIVGWGILSLFFLYYTYALFGYVFEITWKRFSLLLIYSLFEIRNNLLKGLKRFSLLLGYPSKNPPKPPSKTKELKYALTGLRFLDDLFRQAETDKEVMQGSVILFEGELGSSIGHLMVHLLYLGLQQGHYSIYVAANRPPEIVLRSFDEKIGEANKSIENFICCIVSLHKQGLIENREIRSEIIRDFIYELEKFTYKDLWKEKFQERIEECIRNEFINDDSNNNKSCLTNLINNGLIDKECRPKQSIDILPTFKDYLQPRDKFPGLLFVVDYNAVSIGETRTGSIYSRPYIPKNQYFKVSNALDIENLHDCLKTIRMVITTKDPDNAKPIRQTYDTSSTIFYLTARDKDMMHKTMNMFFHQVSSAKKYNYIIFHSFKRGLHEEKYFQHLEHIANGVVSLSIDKEIADETFRFLEVVKMENVITSTKKIPYRLKDGFIEKIWW